MTLLSVLVGYLIGFTAGLLVCVINDSIKEKKKV